MGATRDRGTVVGDSAYKVLFRTAFYIVIVAWILLALYIFFLDGVLSKTIMEYLLSAEQSGFQLRYAMLLIPLVLIVLGYLIDDRAKLFRKAILAERELRERSIEVERINDLLTQENSERKKAEDLLTRQAFYDSLTNLPNRALFIDRLGGSLERKKRYPEHSFAVLFLDLDRFKVINDSLGHMIGDQLLIMLAQRLKRHIRAVDTIARFGGDEFGVLLEETSELSGAEDIAERFHKEMKAPFSIFGREVFATISIGIVMSTMGDYTRPEELLRDADIAMYHAKERGKACHVVFDSTMHAEATMALWLETELRRAVEQKEKAFVVYYQPIVSVEKDRLIGYSGS
jgi:diguanylate cyclase (GGDEF)-like protein